jgi:hypothetical protein
MRRDLGGFILRTLETRSVLIPALGEFICQASVHKLIIETVDHLKYLLGILRRIVNRNFLLFLVLWGFLKGVLSDEGAIGRTHRVRIL